VRLNVVDVSGELSSEWTSMGGLRRLKNALIVVLRGRLVLYVFILRHQNKLKSKKEFEKK
jgi:hypothetical protein